MRYSLFVFDLRVFTGAPSAVLLKDEQAELDLAGLTLPVLKMLTTRGCATREGESASLPRVINGMLSACLLNFDAVR